MDLNLSVLPCRSNKNLIDVFSAFIKESIRITSFSICVINYVIMTSQCAQRTFKIYTIKKTGVLTIVILRRFNNCNIGAGTTGALPTNTQHKQRFLNGKPKVSRPCTYCVEAHRSDKCDKITSVEERCSILKRQHGCLNCLGLKHTKIECYSKGRCMKCKRKHHTSICEEKQENSTQSSSYQMKENRTSNSSQSPTNTIAKNTTHMGATHSLQYKSYPDAIRHHKDKWSR